MSIGMLADMPGVSKQQYDAAMSHLGLQSSMPGGGSFHVAGPTTIGWRVVDLWQSQEAFDEFFQQALIPAMAFAGIPGGDPDAAPSTWPITSTLAQNPLAGEPDYSQAVAILFEIETGTQEQYDNVLDHLNLDGVAESGGLFHIAGPTESGFRVVDVWETQDAFDEFFRNKLSAAVRVGGFPPFEPSFFPVHNVITKATTPASI